MGDPVAPDVADLGTHGCAAGPARPLAARRVHRATRLGGATEAKEGQVLVPVREVCDELRSQRGGLRRSPSCGVGLVGHPVPATRRLPVAHELGRRGHAVVRPDSWRALRRRRVAAVAGRRTRRRCTLRRPIVRRRATTCRGAGPRASTVSLGRRGGHGPAVGRPVAIIVGSVASGSRHPPIVRNRLRPWTSPRPRAGRPVRFECPDHTRDVVADISPYSTEPLSKAERILHCGPDVGVSLVQFHQ